MRRSTVATERGSFAVLVGEPQQTDPASVATPPTPVVLVPGYTGSKEDFLAVLGPLAAAGHRVVAMDLRGQHETPGSEDAGAYELAELAADVLAVVAAIGGSAHLVGHSFGGFVTGTAALSADPGVTVESLTLMDCGMGPVTGEGTRMSLAMLSGALPVQDMETIWAAKRAMERQRGDAALPPAIEEFLHARFTGTHPVGLTVAAGQLLAPEDRAAALADAGPPVPVLVLYGTGEDVWSPTGLAALADRIGAESQVVDGAGHSPAVDDPDTTAAALIAFWQRAGGR